MDITKYVQVVKQIEKMIAEGDDLNAKRLTIVVTHPDLYRMNISGHLFGYSSEQHPESNMSSKEQFEYGKELRRGIIETDSELILNGVRASIKQNTINSENVVIYYFDYVDNSPAPMRLHVISIDKNGSLDKWPDGFMGMFEKSLIELI